jgi:hypothetical protein
MFLIDSYLETGKRPVAFLATCLACLTSFSSFFDSSVLIFKLIFVRLVGVIKALLTVDLASIFDFYLFDAIILSLIGI